MIQPKYLMGQKVWALRGTGRWGEPTGVKGTIINVLQSFTSGKCQYTIKLDVNHSDNIVQLWEDQISVINED